MGCRCAADPEFPFNGANGRARTGSIGHDCLARKGNAEGARLAICDIAVGGNVNFILVYMFTLVAFPTASASAIEKLLANMFVACQYSLLMRVSGSLYKGVPFADSLVGTSSWQCLISIRVRRRRTRRRRNRSPRRRQLVCVGVVYTPLR